MPHRALLYIVCSPRPRTGRTLLARLLTEFQVFNGQQPLAYDLNRHENTLAGFLPQYTQIANIDDTRGQIALFDALIAGGEYPRILDLGNDQLDPFFTSARQIGFMEEAQRRGVEPIILFIADPQPRSAEIYGHLQQSFKRNIVVPVENQANFSVDPYMNRFPALATERGLLIPRLNPVICGIIEKPRFSFATFMASPGKERTEIHEWLEQIFVEFRELGLYATLHELRATLKL